MYTTYTVTNVHSVSECSDIQIRFYTQAFQETANENPENNVLPFSKNLTEGC